MTSRLQLEGVFTAIVTPFKEDGSGLDLEGIDRLLTHQIEGGVAGVVPVGTTGESPTLTAEEKEILIKKCVEKAAGKIKVIAGTGTNNTATTIEASLKAKELGADALLIVNPYYNKPSQEGMFRHVKAVADATDMPIVLYNIPGRCGIALSAQTVARMYNEIPQVCAIKEATGSLDMASEIASLCDITILSGDDSLTLPLMSVGGKGVVSVLSNLSPEKVVGMVNKALGGDFGAASKEHISLFPVFKAMFVESNPVPCKMAMSMNGICTAAVRLPLAPMTEDNIKILTTALVAKGLVSEENARKRPKN